MKNQKLLNLQTMVYEARQAERLLTSDPSIKHGQTMQSAAAEWNARADKARVFVDKVRSLELEKQASAVKNKALEAANALKNNPNAARATATAVGTGAGVGVGTATAGGTGTGLLTTVGSAGALPIATTVGAGVSIGASLGCISYRMSYYGAMQNKLNLCALIAACRTKEQNREWCATTSYFEQLADVQNNIATYGNLYNSACLRFIPRTTNVPIDLSCPAAAIRTVPANPNPNF